VKSILELTSSRLRDFEPCVHGGEVWEVARRNNVSHRSLLDLSANINPLGPPRKAMEAIKNCLKDIPMYPDSNSLELRRAISNYIGGIGHENVIVGNGSTELIYLFAETFLDEGDEALIPTPTFGEYAKAVMKSGGKPKHVRMNQDFTIDANTLLSRCGPKTKAIFICNPNNPTSTLLLRSGVQEIVDMAAQHGTMVFLDEDFMEFIQSEKRYSFAKDVQKHGNLFVLRSFTKFFALTGLRVGYGVACEEIIEVLHKLKIPWNVNCVAQAAAEAALKDNGYMDKTEKLIEDEIGFLQRKLSRIGVLNPFRA